jgi:hypothetical protein
MDDASGETEAPISSGIRRAASTTTDGHVEMRIPFSSLRYKNADPADLGHHAVSATIPRTFRYRIASARCRAAATARSAARIRVTGLEGLPAAGTSWPLPMPARVPTRGRATAWPARRSVGEKVEPRVGLD